MIAPAKIPQYLLFTDADDGCDAFDRIQPGKWCFLLESLDGEEMIEASDYEVGLAVERLELLAVVRGLEALDQPSRVVLVTPSRYVNRGIRFGMDAWREADWKWEHFGLLTPIKNDDLWKRIDRAMEIHHVECRRWRLDRGVAGEVAESMESETSEAAALVKAPSMAPCLGETVPMATLRDGAGVSVGDTVPDMAVLA